MVTRCTRTFYAKTPARVRVATVQIRVRGGARVGSTKVRESVVIVIHALEVGKNRCVAKNADASLRCDSDIA
ncbi:hypothetical protein E2542_SST20913 [Spatholobus suberectus]|nr:hypothetical protein E2542_SST20913 [Spatholobus suberectus]